MDNNINNAQKAEIIAHALPHIQKYRKKTVVVKYGGNAMINDELKEAVMRDLVLLTTVGIKVVLVHGGGPAINKTLEKMHIESKFENGLRVTDKDTVDVVQMVLAGKINKTLVNHLEGKGGHAMGISGVDGHLIEAERKDERLGFVGEITRVNAAPVTDLLEKGYIPVVSTVGCDDDGNVYNINADTAAAYIAGAINAERLILMTDIAGVLRDKDDPDSLIPCIDIEEAKSLFNTNVISGGMIPKVECCITAIEKGVKKAIIMDGRVPHSILIETLSDDGAGTMVVKEYDK